MGIAREGDSQHAVALWRQVRETTPSVRQFRAGKAAGGRQRSPVRKALLAARRLSRALRVLLAEAGVPAAEAPGLARALRRTRRLVERQLDALAEALPTPIG
jgi:hypothetical protein